MAKTQEPAAQGPAENKAGPELFRIEELRDRKSVV